LFGNAPHGDTKPPQQVGDSPYPGVLRQAPRVVKAQMDIAKHFVAVEIDIEEVKNDMMRRGIIESAVGFTPPEDLKGFYVGAIAEIEDM